MPVTSDQLERSGGLEWEFFRSSGPGGQNVNKVSTAVRLRFDAANSPLLSEDVRLRLARLAGKRMTEDGAVIIEARRFRTQERNRGDALQRLVRLIAKAWERPAPRRPTRPTPASQKRRVEQKKRRSRIKRDRTKVENEA